MKRQHWVILFAVLSVGVLWFIFSHSLQSRVESTQQSAGWFALFRPILDPRNQFPEDVVHNAVRKMAHFAEFGALGVCVGGFTINLGWMQNRRYVALPMLITLLAAVCDEWIQHFTGRASMVTDVVLDYGGALTGLLFSAVFALIWCRCAHRKQERIL